MLSQRLMSRLSQRAGQQLRSTPARPAVQRRFNSTAQDKMLKGFPDNAFNRERAAVKKHAAATSDLWRKLSIYAVIPCLILGGLNAYNLWVEHWEHEAHLPPLEERVEYPYQNLRQKNYPWGNGDETLFWNPKVNYHDKNKTT